MGKKYGYKWHTIGVGKSLSGNNWIVAWKGNDGKEHRVTSKLLPPCATAEECQENLDAWALKKGLKEVKNISLPKEKKTQPGHEVTPGGLISGEQYLLKRRDKPGSSYRPVEYRGMEDGYHRFYATGYAYVRPIHPLSEAALCHYEIRAYAS